MIAARHILHFMPALAALCLAGCAQLQPTPPALVHQPMTARPQTSGVRAQPMDGAIYHGGVSSLFADRRARQVGDTLTIQLVEQTSATKNNTSSTERSSSMGGGINGLSKLPLGALVGLSADASSSSSFEGKGNAAANNSFSGTITVTVIEALANGNLLVSGEKQMAINQGNEYIRFSGVVNPDTISPSNTVQSTQVADARIEYKGSGAIAEAQQMGWLQRFFTIISPF